ncbi:hypothetical protein LguiB_017026 [Lonicera macranthoides]
MATPTTTTTDAAATATAINNKPSSVPPSPPPLSAAPPQPQEASPEITAQQPPPLLQSSPNPTTSTVATETPATTNSKQTSRHPEPQSSDVIHIPSYSRWFSWKEINECEVRFLPEFFDGRSPSKNPRVYQYYRNTIIRRFRDNPGPPRKITFTEARKSIVGDVGSVRRVFDFLEAWGLINYSPPSTNNNKGTNHFKWEDNTTTTTKSNSNSNTSTNASDPAVLTSATDFSVPKNRWCSGCKSVCTIACFYCDKHDLTLCARCYVRQNYRVGVSSSDFRRVEISEEVKADWNDKETLHLLEAVMQYGDNWKKVSEHVGGRSERECVNRFIKLPFGDQFVGQPDSAEVDDNFYQTKDQTDDAESGLQSSATVSSTKRMRFTPLADASNPIMAQVNTSIWGLLKFKKKRHRNLRSEVKSEMFRVGNFSQAAFLSALVGVDVAEVAAHAAVRALADGKNGKTSTNTVEGADTETQLQLQKEEQDLERKISDIAVVQLKEIKEKIVGFEEFELQMEREWQQLEQMKNMLFVDQLTLLFHKAAAPTTRESTQENIKIA